MEFNYIIERESTEINIDIAQLLDKINKMKKNNANPDQIAPLKNKLKFLQDEKKNAVEKEKKEN